MSIQYKLMKNEIKSSKNYGKYYAHTVRRGHVTLEDIEELVEKATTATRGDVRLVVGALFDYIKSYMQAGYVVQLGDLGSFSIAVKSICVDDPDEFRNDRHLAGFRCKYTPAGHRMRPNKGESVGRIQRGLLEGCKAERIKVKKTKKKDNG